MLANPRHEAFAQAVALGKSGAAAFHSGYNAGVDDVNREDAFAAYRSFRSTHPIPIPIPLPQP
jgi:hypothetical protein